MLQKLLAIASSNIIISAASLIRNIIIARLLSPEEFGKGAIFALVITFFEITSDMSVEKQVVQSKQGQTSRFLASSHFVNVIRGGLVALLIYSSASFMAVFFKSPELIPAFQFLALIPFIKGFKHLCVVQRQRALQFLPAIKSELYPQLISLLVVYPCYLYLGDYRVFVAVVAFNVLFSVLLSHVFAQKKYRVLIDKKHIYSLLAFGWPLLLNGLIIFSVMQADRAVIGRWFGFEILGYFSAAFSLTIMPVLILSKILNTAFLPLLSAGIDKREYYNRASGLLLRSVFFLGCFYMVGLYVLGGYIYTIIYGKDYASGAWFMSILAVSHGVRILRIAPSLISLSEGKTVYLLYANILRAIGFIVGVVFVIYDYDLAWLLISSIIGEALALILGCVLCRSFSFFDYRDSLAIISIATLIVIIFALSNNFYLFFIMAILFLSFYLYKARRDLVELLGLKAA